VDIHLPKPNPGGQDAEILSPALSSDPAPQFASETNDKQSFLLYDLIYID
jgi:hypothetical protein